MPIRRVVRRFHDLPLRRKLILSFLVVIALGGVLTSMVGTRIEHHTIISLAEAKVRHDLASAWMVYEERLYSLRDTFRLSATQEFLRAPLRQADLDRVAVRLDGIRAEFGLDVLNLTDALGRVVVRSRRPDAPVGDDVARDPFVALEGRDEVGQLARAFNRMTDELSLAHEDLTQWGRTLEQRVEERTRELRKTQDQLVVSENLASLGKMAAGVAHEINNPLTTILINAHLLLERPGRNAEEGETLNLIADETTRCAATVRGLLDFARQTPSQAAPTDINDVIDRTLMLLEMQASVSNIRIERALDRTLPPIEVDKNKIQQVFSNLAINACEAMPKGGTLVFRSLMSRDGTHIEVTFTDTGVGISKENFHRLFDPFFTTKSFGTGLGLAVSYGIIRQRGGTILVRSEVDKGTVFTVRIPLADPGEEKRIEEAPQ